MDQDVQVRLLQAFLLICEDPGAAALDCYAVGVQLGYKQRMPATPAVFEQNRKWRVG